MNIKFRFLRSAGIGRSGTFCVVDCCLVLAEQQEENISIKDILLELRRGRMGLIQTHDQLSFSYEAVIEGIQRLENNVSKLKDPMATRYLYHCRHSEDLRRVEQFGSVR